MASVDAARQPPVITLDGPSGVGKGTVALHLARRSGWHLLDSGALYRLVALIALQRGIPLSEGELLAQAATKMAIRFSVDPVTERIMTWLEDEPVDAELRSEECGNRASQIAVHPQVRSALLDFQRSFQLDPGLIADGRDMGTVVFPDAALKIYLTASAPVRAVRRQTQLKQQGADVSLARLIEEIEARDQRDATRSVAPLRPASDALLIDTTDLGIEAVVARIWQEAENRHLVKTDLSSRCTQ